MRLYLLVHTINSPLLKLKLELYLSEISDIINQECQYSCCTYEIQTGLCKKELIKLLKAFVKSMRLCEDERVVLYDPEICSDIFEMPDKNEKILLHGDFAKEIQVDKIMITVFRHIKMRMELEKIEKKYFRSLPKNKES